MKKVHPSLRRKKATLNPKRRFILYCEGKNTEPKYFRALGARYGNALISIETIAPAGVPYSIAEKAAALRQEMTKEKRNSYEIDDQVWAIFDRDDHPRYEDAIGLCIKGGVRVGRSNPCFELWLILHLTDFDKPDGRNTVQKAFEKEHPEYCPKKGKLPNYSNLVAYVQNAEDRARAQILRREQEGMPMRPPYTTVWELTKEIRKASQ